MKTSLSVIISLLPLLSYAQGNLSDSIQGKKLNEVVVEGQMQSTSPGLTTYYPDKQSKRAAQNAVDLLNYMGIPQINVNPVAGSVTTPGGEEVAIYIDMEEASQVEKDALRPEDVKKVEYYVFPTDPRFNHAKYVINITLRSYEYGGYAKFSGTGNVMAGSGSGLGYAKIAYKRMTYDISVNDKFTDSHHTGSEQRQVFRFPQDGGPIQEIMRDNILDYSRFTENQLGVSFRARYTSDKSVITNSFAFSSINTPHSDNSGRLVFSDDIFRGDSYSGASNSTYIYPRWRGNYYFNIGNGFKFNAVPAVFYQRTKSNSMYKSDESSIVTDAVEDAITGQLQFQLNKTISRRHTFDINLLGLYYYDKVKYTGNTVASPEFNQFAYGGMIGYTYAGNKFYGRFSAGIAGEANRISGVTNNSCIPLLNVNGQYAFNRRHSISLSVQYNVDPAKAADKTPDIIQENELLYKTGNPHLKNVHWSNTALEYTFLPDNRFSISAFAGWRRYFNHFVPVFTPDGPDGMMLRTIENNGDCQEIYVGTSLTARLLDRRLVLRATPQVYFEQLTGLYAERNRYVSLSLSATYYIDKFYLSAFYSPASRSLQLYSLDATSSKGRSSYQLKAGWSNGRWNLSASAVNIFRRDWISSSSSLTSRWFDQYTTEYGAASHQFVSLTASYTFGFGKKVKRGDEVQGIESGSSAIMK